MDVVSWSVFLAAVAAPIARLRPQNFHTGRRRVQGASVAKKVLVARSRHMRLSEIGSERQRPRCGRPAMISAYAI
jgi:hypothetical protein